MVIQRNMDLQGGFWLKRIAGFLLIFSVVLTRGQNSDNSVDDPGDESVVPVLYKCDGSVEERNLSMSDELRLPYPEQKLEYFKKKFQTEILYNFSLVERVPGCKDGEFELEIPFRLDPAQPRLFNFTPDGYLGSFKDTQEIYYHRHNYCIARITEKTIWLKVCKSQCGLERNVSSNDGNICLEKCCTLGQVVTPQGCKDVMGRDWSPGIYSRLKSKDVIEPPVFPQIQYNYYNYHWRCGPNETLSQTLHSDQELRILEDGRIFARKPGKRYWFELYGGKGSRSFCIDGVWLINGTDEYEPTLSKYIVRSCKSNTTQPGNLNNDYFYLYIYPQILFGVTFFATLIHLLTLTVHICLWERQQNVHGWTIFMFCMSQFILTLFLCILFGVFGFGDPEEALNGSLHDLCIMIGIIHHFFLIYSFSCSTILTFDVFYKLRSTTTGGSKGRKKFMAYCSVGVSIPMIMVFVGILMEFAIGDPDEDSLIRPGYSKTCVIQSSWQYFIYIGFVIMILFVTNMVLALLTLKSLWDAMRSMKTFKDSQTSANFENKAQLVAKLCVMMGAFLIIEVVLAFTSPLSVSHVFVFLDFYRVFHAIGLFWVFVCNKRTLVQLGAKYVWLKKVSSQFQPTQQTTSAVMESSNQDRKDTGGSGDRKISLTTTTTT